MQQSAKIERQPGFLPRSDFQKLLDGIVQSGYQLLGPVVKDGAIQLMQISDVTQLAKGLTNEQQPGHYRLQQTAGERLFDWNHGPQGLKPLCFAPHEVLWVEQKDPLSFTTRLPDVKPTAVLGVRGCDLSALAIQDRHFLHAAGADPHYRQRREQLLLIGIDCAHSAESCFCASTGDGPSVNQTVDIGLSELDDGFLVWSGSDQGEAVLQRLDLATAQTQQLEQMEGQTEQAAREQQRQLPKPEELIRLYQRLEHAHWQQVADRCLGCGNCTAVCPTCFCYDTQHEVSLDGLSAQNVRQWDSCFSASHSSMGAFKVRGNILSRYRQWLTHKLAGWQEQQGRIGCTGCGRCITWCPVGIDLTKEADAILWEGSLDE
ncbi:MAG: 4Fe-4S dicluster domain-containing protein [Candidatus Thiodiazotropha lotti]|nr:4Fe-4S dicluster domain-containing protein [Candidatus Thiodiazotropha lotti]